LEIQLIKTNSEFFNKLDLRPSVEDDRKLVVLTNKPKYIYPIYPLFSTGGAGWTVGTTKPIYPLFSTGGAGWSVKTTSPICPLQR